MAAECREPAPVPASSRLPWHYAHQRQRVEHVLLHHLVRVGDGGQVDRLVPPGISRRAAQQLELRTRPGAANRGAPSPIFLSCAASTFIRAAEWPNPDNSSNAFNSNRARARLRGRCPVVWCPLRPRSNPSANRHAPVATVACSTSSVSGEALLHVGVRDPQSAGCPHRGCWSPALPVPRGCERLTRPVRRADSSSLVPSRGHAQELSPRSAPPSPPSSFFFDTSTVCPLAAACRRRLRNLLRDESSVVVKM